MALSGDTQSLYHKAVQYGNNGELNRSLELFEAVLASEPYHVQSLQHAVSLHNHFGNYGRALDWMRHIVELRPDDALVRANMGMILMRSGHDEAAGSEIEKALSLDDKDTEQIFRIAANYFMAVGDRHAAGENLLKAYELSPQDHHLLFMYLKNAHDLAGTNDPYLDKLKALEADKAAIQAEDLPDLYYCLAHAHKQLGDYDREFDYLIRAGEEKRKSLNYDEAAKVRFQQVMLSYFAPEMFEVDVMSKLGCDSELPVFITGMPRSGTTLVERILVAHADIGSVGEYPAVDQGLEALQLDMPQNDKEESFPYGRVATGQQTVPPQLFAQSYVNEIQRKRPDSKRVINKVLSSYTWLGLVAMLWPKAKIIHVRRHPLDSAVSSFAQHYSGNKQQYSYRLDELGRYYRLYNQYMDHWRTVIPEDMILEVDYEALVDDLEGQARRMVAFLGLDWDAQCLDYHEQGGLVKTASRFQVNKPVYTSALGKWKRYAKHLQPLIEGMGEYAPEDLHQA